MQETFRPTPGIAWRRVQEQGILIQPRHELMIALTPAGFAWWEELAAGRPVPGRDAEVAEFVHFLRRHGLLEPAEPTGDSRPEAPLPPQVAWMEAFRPLAYTASCGRLPGGGGPCDPVPSGS